MADDKPTREQQTEAEFTNYAKDIAKVVGKFMLDMGKLAGRGLWLAYRAIGRRRMQEARSGEAAERKGNEAVEQVRERVRGMFGRGENADETETETHTANDEATYIDPDAVEDAEAAAQLEALLKETASKSSGEAPPEDDEPAATEIPVEVTETEATTPPPAPTAPPQPSPEEVAAQLEERKARLDETGGPAPDPDAERQAAIRAQMEADKARIRAEREERQQAFHEAEAERRQREQTRKDVLRQSRLADAEPTDKDTSTADEDTERKQNKDQ